MRVKYDKKNLNVQYGDICKIQFQRGSLINHKRNGISDTDLLIGLALYLEDMNKRHRSVYNDLALGNLQSAFEWLKIRRGLSHSQAKDKK